MKTNRIHGAVYLEVDDADCPEGENPDAFFFERFSSALRAAFDAYPPADCAYAPSPMLRADEYWELTATFLLCGIDEASVRDRLQTALEASGLGAARYRMYFDGDADLLRAPRPHPRA